MKTQEQLAVLGDFPIGLWDTGPHETAWSSLRSKAAEIAAADGKVLAGDGQTRSVLFMRAVEGADGKLADVECSRDEAGFVRLPAVLLGSGGLSAMTSVQTSLTCNFPPAGTHVLVRHWHDSGGIEAVYGPFTEEHAKWLLAEIAEGSTYAWTMTELRSFDPLAGSPLAAHVAQVHEP